MNVFHNHCYHLEFVVKLNLRIYCVILQDMYNIFIISNLLRDEAPLLANHVAPTCMNHFL